jgi:hypothetical protein
MLKKLNCHSNTLQSQSVSRILGHPTLNTLVRVVHVFLLGECYVI